MSLYLGLSFHSFPLFSNINALVCVEHLRICRHANSPENAARSFMRRLWQRAHRRTFHFAPNEQTNILKAIQCVDMNRAHSIKNRKLIVEISHFRLSNCRQPTQKFCQMTTCTCFYFSKHFRAFHE